MDVAGREAIRRPAGDDDLAVRLHGDPVEVNDARAVLEDPPPAGSEAELWIEDFGMLPIEIMHAGEHFCGVAIVNPSRHRDRLLEWLRQEATTGGPAAAVR